MGLWCSVEMSFHVSLGLLKEQYPSEEDILSKRDEILESARRDLIEKALADWGNAEGGLSINVNREGYQSIGISFRTEDGGASPDVYVKWFESFITDGHRYLEGYVRHMPDWHPFETTVRTSGPWDDDEDW